MRHFGASLAAILMSVSAVPDAQACRVMLPPRVRIADAYARDAKLQVALVRITEARRLVFPMSAELRRKIPDYEDPWRVNASVTRMLVGKQSPELVVFDRGWGSAACDDRTKMPRKGDEWIVYHGVGRRGEAVVVETYPVAVARREDPKLRNIVR